jgi:hypothetical protein
VRGQLCVGERAGISPEAGRAVPAGEHYRAAMNEWRRRARIALVVTGTALAVSGCKAHTPATGARPSNSPVSVAQAESAFRLEGIPLRVALDFRVLNERKILRLTRAKPHDVAVQRAARAQERAYLELLRRGSGMRPVMWLDERQGFVTLVVWRHAAEARIQVAGARRFASPGVPFSIVAARNVVVLTSGDAPKRVATRVNRAIARLRLGRTA